MEPLKTWQESFQSEIKQAEAARACGNEGKARVCARRAAGIIIGEYFRSTGIADPGPSAYDRLRQLAQIEHITDEMRQVAGHFTVRTDLNHNLPIQADLIAEARWIAQVLLGNNSNLPDQL